MVKTEKLDPDNMPIWLSKIWPAKNYAPFVFAGVNDDDCAVMNWDESILVVTTDYLNSKPISVQLKIGNLRTLGRLVVAANLADLLGSGANPRSLMIGITMPRSSTTNDYKRLIKGVHYEANKWGIPVVGGDSKLGTSLAILGIAIGSASCHEELFLKNNAKAGDSVWVSGYIGSSSAAVLGLQDSNMTQAWQKWAVNVLTVPNLPFSKSYQLSKLRIGHGGTDISDGLGVD